MGVVYTHERVYFRYLFSVERRKDQGGILGRKKMRQEKRFLFK